MTEQLEAIPLRNFKYKAKREDLQSLAAKGRDRDEFCEELYVLETLGGDGYFTEQLGVDLNRGINNSEATDRIACYGSNEKKVIPAKSFLTLVWEALEDFTLRILVVAAVVSIVAHTATAEGDDRKTAWIDGVAIMVAVTLAVLVGSINNYQREREFRRLNDISDERKLVTVFRDNKTQEIHISKIVVGDVIKIFEGMEIPVDGYIIEAHEVTTDESAMTGESDPIKKNVLSECLVKRDQLIAEGCKNTAGKHEVASPILLSGTKVLTGDGRFVTTVVGEYSIMGQIKTLIQTDTEATPLQQKLEKIAGDIGKGGLVGAIFTVVILLIRFLVERGQTDTWGKGSEYTKLVEFFIIGITVIVVAIPEGLPLAVTLSLAFSVKKMLKDNNMVRRMEACETMGGANMICSDKTGTLTQNKMTVTTIWNEKMIYIDTNLSKQDLTQYFPSSMQELFHQGFGCNTSATLDPPKGSKTDIAMLELLLAGGQHYTDVKAKYLPNPGYTKFPFTSARKRQSTVVEAGPTGKRLHIKGASEFVLECCTQWHSFSNDLVQPITPQTRVKLEMAIEEMADQALRTICLAYKPIDGTEDFTSHDEHGVYNVEKNNLILFGILGIKDILRPEVKDAVAKCKIAGIKVRMVTGDNKSTARAIARECGIIDPNDPNSLVMEGKEFQQRTGGVVCAKCQVKECDCPRTDIEAGKAKKPVRVDTILHKEEFDKIVRHLDVLARSRPEDKYALVTGLMEKDNVVAVTGDGTNDAPALKKANVGFAMGIAGTEVSREAAAIILLDDNFNSIVKAVLWGRNIYDSIRKFLQFQLTVNVVAVISTMIGAALLQDDVLTPVQMLWVNLIMDTLASLALATEPPKEELLHRKPHGKNDYIVSKVMTKHILIQSFYQILIMCIVVFDGDNFLPEYEDCSATRPCNWFYSDAEATVVGTSVVFDTPGKYMRSGREYTVAGDHDYKDILEHYGPSRHFTFVFNVFVVMTIFNFFNARKIHDEFNIFEGVSKSPLFIIIVIIITGGQLIIGNLGGRPLRVSFDSMDVRQWLIACAFGFGTWIVSVLIKLIPNKYFIEGGNKMQDPLSEPSKILNLKRTSNEEVIQRKFTNPAMRNNSKQSSLGKVHYHNVAH